MWTPGGANDFFTYLGGSSNDKGLGIALDSNRDIFVTGWSDSPDFYTLNAPYPLNQGGRDAFITEYSGSDAPIYSTYFGGSGRDEGHGIALENNTNQYAYITGVTYSPDFPVVPEDNPLTGPNTYTSQFGDAFIAKFNPDSTINWSTRLGGPNSDVGNAITLDMNNNIYVTGSTNSIQIAPNYFPIKNPLPNFGLKQAFQDAFITMVESNLSAYNFSTYFGGGLDETGTGIAVNDTTNIFVSGFTSSYDFPTWNTFNVPSKYNGKNYGGWDDAFVMHITNLPTPAAPHADFFFAPTTGTAPDGELYR